MPVENQVMRLPRYARGLKLVRIGMFLMLLHFLLNAYFVTVMIRAGVGDEDHLVAVMKWTLYANIGAIGVMLLGALLAVPDFLLAKMPLWRLVTSIVGFAIAIAALAWSAKVLFTFASVASDPHATFLEVQQAADDLESLRMMTILRDIAYGIGVVAMLRSIRQTAQANEHYTLRDVSDRVTNLTTGLVILDVLYQLLFGGGAPLLSLSMVILGLLGGIGIIVFWVYTHLRLAKFLKAAAILVYEPHNLPVAQLIVRVKAADNNKPEPASVPIRPSAPTPSSPVAKPIVPTHPSQPLMVVAAELRPASVPRAETAPGTAEEPKLLR